MNTLNLKSALAAVAWSLLAPVAQAEGLPAATDFRTQIAAQGNAALEEIRTELLIARVLAMRPPLPIPSRPAARAAVARPHPHIVKVGA